MTDLIKELRGLSAGPSGEMERIGNKAANRIEQLAATCEELVKELNISRMASVVMDNTVEKLEAKLAKAVEALRESVKEFDCPIARTVLAELEGK